MDLIGKFERRVRIAAISPVRGILRQARTERGIRWEPSARIPGGYRGWSAARQEDYEIGRRNDGTGRHVVTLSWRKHGRHQALNWWTTRSTDSAQLAGALGELFGRAETALAR
jgi:hypothetical protein